MLRAHKRKSRRVSGGGGRSVSPRPSVERAHPAVARPPATVRKANTAPSSPLDGTSTPTIPSSDTTWNQRSLPPAPPPDGSVPSETVERATNPGARPQPASSGQQHRKQSSGEPTMGTLLTEWFQKLFAPNDGTSSSGGARAGGGPSSSSSAPVGTKSGGAASAKGARGAQASEENTEIASNRTSASSEARPPSPPQGDSAAAPVAAGAEARGDAGVDGRAPTEEIAPAQGSAPSRGAGGDSAASGDAPTEGAALATAATAEATAKPKPDGGEGEQAGISPRFLGLFSRGFSGKGSWKEGNEKGETAAEPAAAEAVNDAAPSSTPCPPPTTSTDQQTQPAAAHADAAAMAAAAAAAAATTAEAAPPPSASAGGNGAPPDAANGSAAAAAAAANAGAGAADSAGTGAGAPGASGTAAAAAAAGAGGEAKAGAVPRREGGSGSSASRSTSPSRSAALSVGSDDGEEENLFTVGTHQGARPSIDDFSSLRVLGKGSYGKVVLVRRKSTGVLYAMKILKKGDVVRKRQVERTKIERRVLGNVEHPFLMRLHYAFQTDNKLYLVLDYCPGGELFFHLSRYKRFPEGVVRFYTAELVLALKHLHDNNIIYRDIKPENILLDADGHIKLGDFGLAKDNVTDSTFGAQSVCGTPEYMAPEVINKAGHGTAVDWWGLGMLMYEMLTGLPPWYTKDRQKLFERLRGAPLVIPKNVSAPSASIIGGLLTRNPSKRLGTLGALQVMNHEFFRGLDWAALLAKRIPAPLNPCRNQRQGSESTHNFDPQFTRMPIDTMALGGAIVSPGPDGHFDGFTYEIPGVILESDR